MKRIVDGLIEDIQKLRKEGTEPECIRLTGREYAELKRESALLLQHMDDASARDSFYGVPIEMLH